MPVSYDIDFYDDIAEFINRLEKFDQDVSKELKAGIKQGASFVVSAAKGLVPATPLSNWGRSWLEQDRQAGRQIAYNQAKAKQQVIAKAYRARARGTTVAYGYYVIQKNPAASIFELAGKENPNGTPASRCDQARPGSYTFNPNLLSKFGDGPYPRVLYPAYYAGMPKARIQIERAVKEAMLKVGQ